ncbi:39179_t:CDS:2 [Gigaspora margarita]|uniref:39179_t:CDS:1 n=1 Tax=Gigaspora margarita TaxID=4874 RepID=A0ABN7VBL0_GIGMA|nr:39179_t:CDS:2 [Gigaspora margarita]
MSENATDDQGINAQEEQAQDNQDDVVLPPELQDMYNKLDRTMKERYRKCKTKAEKIILLETTMHERKKGKYEISSVFIAISALIVTGITIVAKIFENETFINFIIIMNSVLLPSCIGIILAALLGRYVVPLTVSISWIGVGVSISTLFLEIFE